MSPLDTDLSITREIEIDAPADVVWQTLTEPERITRWFPDRLDLDLADGALREGAAGTFAFDDPASGGEFVAPVVIGTLDRPHRFTFRWGHEAGADATAATSMLVEFTLEPLGPERTRLRVVESGFDRIGWTDEAKASYAKDHREGWQIHFDRLAGVLS